MSSVIDKRLKKDPGFSLMEMIFYVAIIALVLSVSVSVIYSLTRSYRRLQSAWLIETAATTALERITRETRNSLSIDQAQSILDASPGKLFLNTTDESGAAATVEFLVSGQAIRVKEAGVDAGPLTPSKARVTSLTFHRLSGIKSQAIKIELTVESGTSTSYQTKNFYSTTVMRGSYPLE